MPGSLLSHGPGQRGSPENVSYTYLRIGQCTAASIGTHCPPHGTLDMCVEVHNELLGRKRAEKRLRGTPGVASLQQPVLASPVVPSKLLPLWSAAAASGENIFECHVTKTRSCNQLAFACPSSETNVAVCESGACTGEAKVTLATTFWSPENVVCFITLRRSCNADWPRVRIQPGVPIVPPSPFLLACRQSVVRWFLSLLVQPLRLIRIFSHCAA